MQDGRYTSHMTPAEVDRFMAKVCVTAEGGCWNWQARLDRDGYGMFYLRRRSRRAHRVGWFMLHGPIPAGMVINHQCHNRACVNPQHLGLLTPVENSLRDSYSPASINSRKTHCPRGHEYDRFYRSQRSCSICESDKKRRLRARWRAEDTLAV